MDRGRFSEDLVTTRSREYSGIASVVTLDSAGDLFSGRNPSDKRMSHGPIVTPFLVGDSGPTVNSGVSTKVRMVDQGSQTVEDSTIAVDVTSDFGTLDTGLSEVQGREDHCDELLLRLGVDSTIAVDVVPFDEDSKEQCDPLCHTEDPWIQVTRKYRRGRKCPRKRATTEVLSDLNDCGTGVERTPMQSLHSDDLEANSCSGADRGGSDPVRTSFKGRVLIGKEPDQIQVVGRMRSQGRDTADIHWLVDTGAEKSFISHETYEKHLQEMVPLKSVDIRMFAINGSSVPVYGKCDLGSGPA